MKSSVTIAKEFLNELVNVENAMIESNVRMMKLKQPISENEFNNQLLENIKLIYNSLVDAIMYFEKNSDKLEFCSEEHENLIESWDSFVGTPASAAVLDVKFGVFRDNTIKLVEAVQANIKSKSHLTLVTED